MVEVVQIHDTREQDKQMAVGVRVHDSKSYEPPFRYFPSSHQRDFSSLSLLFHEEIAGRVSGNPWSFQFWAHPRFISQSGLNWGRMLQHDSWACRSKSKTAWSRRYSHFPFLLRLVGLGKLFGSTYTHTPWSFPWAFWLCATTTPGGALPRNWTCIDRTSGPGISTSWFL